MKLLIAVSFFLGSLAVGSTPSDDPAVEQKVYKLEELDVHPEFPGGEKGLLKYLKKNLKGLAPEGTERHIRMGVSIFLTDEGNVGDVEMQQGHSEEVDAQVLAVLRAMPSWKPGEVDGKPVPVRLMIPIFIAP